MTRRHAQGRVWAVRDSHDEISSRRRDVAAGKPLFSYAHSLFWAPYALVGDGGR